MMLMTASKGLPPTGVDGAATSLNLGKPAKRLFDEKDDESLDRAGGRRLSRIPFKDRPELDFRISGLCVVSGFDGDGEKSSLLESYEPRGLPWYEPRLEKVLPRVGGVRGRVLVKAESLKPRRRVHEEEGVDRVRNC